MDTVALAMPLGKMENCDKANGMQTIKNEITIEELRLIQGFENFSDDELSEILKSIKELALLLDLTPSVDIVLKN